MKNNKTILVTGATGFIGGRIVEALYFANSRNVRAGIHNWSSAARIGRLPIDMMLCNILDKEQVLKPFEGVNTVIHCAVGPRNVIVEGTKNMLETSLQKGVERFVHISTVDVYGDATGEVDETFPSKYSGNEYSDAKVDAENLCWDYQKMGLPVTIIRPGIVYGPFSKTWTVRYAERLRSGNWGIFQETGEGVCNCIYIDDLVMGILLTLKKPNAIGEAYNIIGPDVITWNEYFKRFNDTLGLQPLKPIKQSNHKFKTTVMEPVRSLARYTLKNFGDLVMKSYERYDIAKAIMKRFEKTLITTASESELTLFRKEVIYSNKKAKKELGFNPKFNIDSGIKMSFQWLSHENQA